MTSISTKSYLSSVHRNIILSMTCLSVTLVQASAHWSVIGGLNSTFSTQSFNLEPQNMPSVDSSGNVAYLGTTITSGSAIMIIDDTQYADRKMYSTKFAGQPFLGLQAEISPKWNFRMKAIYDSNAEKILDYRSLLYTQNPSSIADVTCYNGSSGCTLSNILPNSEETITITQESHPEIAVSFHYKFSEYFASGPILTQGLQKYTFSLNNSTTTTNFSPSSSELGIESLFKLSDHLSLTTSVQFSNKSSFIKRLLNFTANPDDADSPTYYQLNYVPVATTDPWQACNGYLINGSACDSSITNTETVDDYFYNVDTPTSTGTSISVQSLDDTIGPQLLFNRYAVKATISLEWNYDLVDMIPNKIKKMRPQY